MLNEPVHFISYLPDVGDLLMCPIVKCVIVEVVSKKTYALRECFRVIPEL